jgi:hypothetical protein
MSSIINDIPKALRALIDFLLGNKYKHTIQDQNHTKQDHTIQIVGPVAEENPVPAIEIEPRAFFRWAGNDFDRWLLLIRATVTHTVHGKGIVEMVYRADQRSKIIYLRVLLQRDSSNKVFFASDFNMDDEPFHELLVDPVCNAEFNKGRKLYANNYAR